MRKATATTIIRSREEEKSSRPVYSSFFSSFCSNAFVCVCAYGRGFWDGNSSNSMARDVFIQWTRRLQKNCGEKKLSPICLVNLVTFVGGGGGETRSDPNAKCKVDIFT